MAEADGTGAIVREYIWLDDLPVAAIDASGGSSTLYYIHAGHLGQPLAMTNASKTLVWDAAYEPFGAAQVFTATTSLDLRLPGQQLQAETGLHQNWMRDYDPALGRYAQPDPIGLNGGPNVYSYVGQDPLNAIDLSGQDIIVILAPVDVPYAGHVGILVGNESTEFNYGSVDGPGPGGHLLRRPPPADAGYAGPFATPGDFFRYPMPEGSNYPTYGDRYPDAYRIPTSPEQDRAAWGAFVRSARRPYNVIPNTSNCHDAVSNALRAAGVATPTRDLTPRGFFNGLQGGRPIRSNGKDLTPRYRR
jgi:RHS repeat-associated protein